MKMKNEKCHCGGAVIQHIEETLTVEAFRSWQSYVKHFKTPFYTYHRVCSGCGLVTAYMFDSNDKLMSAGSVKLGEKNG